MIKAIPDLLDKLWFEDLLHFVMTVKDTCKKQDRFAKTR